MTSEETGQAYDTVSHLSRELRVAKAELELYKAKLAMALETLRRYDKNAADYIENNA